MANDIVLSMPGTVAKIGLLLPVGMSFKEWSDVGDGLKGASRSLMWWIGDWINYGESNYGEKYAQAIEVTGETYKSIADAKWVASRFEFSDRSENLGWTHHRFIAPLPHEERLEVLALAELQNWTVRETRLEVNRRRNVSAINDCGETCIVRDLEKLIELGKTFGCIYADPPWLYDNQATRAATGNHYRGLTVDELCALPIGALAASDSHLHLWTTNGFLFDCPRIFAAWGFEFRSTYVWVKPQMGIGNYWRNSHEILLTAIRGEAKRFNDHSLISWGQFDRTEHSTKPEKIRSFLECASVGPYLELFGRRVAEKWIVWGDQIERTMFDNAVKELA